MKIINTWERQVSALRLRTNMKRSKTEDQGTSQPASKTVAQKWLPDKTTDDMKTTELFQLTQICNLIRLS